MIIRIIHPLCEKIGTKLLAEWGIPEKLREYGGSVEEVDLSEHDAASILRLVDLLEPHADAHIKVWGTKKLDFRGTKTMVEDCRRWVRAISGESMKPRTVEHFSALLRLYVQGCMKRMPKDRPFGPRWYKRSDEQGVWKCYYVEDIKYHPPIERRDERKPPSVQVSLQWQEFGGEHEKTITFYANEVLQRTVPEALATHGYIAETDELWADYMKRRETFLEWHEKVGMQMLATGIGNDNCDGNDEENTYWRRINKVELEMDGDRSRVLIDVFYEDPSNNKRDSRVHYDRNYWTRAVVLTTTREEYEEYDDLSYDETPERYLPRHFNLACFDLRRHKRLRIDVGQLTPYEYDSKLGAKLVLPPDSKALIDMLMHNTAIFTDVVKGKSGGSIILCAGKPGTGKTLTAEVYSEVMHRPLYTVQASQLGLTPDELEGELARSFKRAIRWNAILLIDEADVYVASRGKDLKQNAIVGVFLRVLEYYSGMLFLTTNRSDLVDDAIASRCIARIDYVYPTPEDQRKIWDVLCATSGIKVAPEVIDAVIKRYSELSGRDVKNLLKLAQLVAHTRRCEITEDVIRFVKRFKPTGEFKAEEDPIQLPALPQRTRVAG